MITSATPSLDGNVPLAPVSLRPVRIGPEVEVRLRRSGYLALQNVSCEVEGGTVRLHGHLPSYFLKQLAQEIADGVEGAHPLLNQIEVVAPMGRPPSGRDRVLVESVRPDRT